MGAEQIARAFGNGRKAFMPYAMLGYPSVDRSLQVVEALAGAGADLLELGVPFSDPLADGPVIQAAGQRALENNVTLRGCIRMAAGLRAKGIRTPALLMSYINPILAYGPGRAAADAAAAGVDGFIVPDLPPEEAGELETACLERNLALAYLLAPTSSPERVELVTRKSTGFIYLVSLTGVTGERNSLQPGLADFVARVRRATTRPLAVGFGIRNGEQARAAAALVDGVIVGSALVRRAGESLESLRSLAVELRSALD